MRDFRVRVEEARATLAIVDFPVQIVVETTSVCNLKCPACPSPVLERPRGFMAPEIFRRIVDEVVHESPTTEIYPAYMGEPLLYKHLFECIRYAIDKGVQRVFLNTNGMLLNERVCNNLIEYRVPRVIVSIDGHSQETYVKRRVGGKFDQVINNTRRLLRRVRETGSPLDVWVQLIVDKGNEFEEEAFKSFWLDEGAIVKIRPQLTWGGRVEGDYLSEVAIERIPCPWLMRQMVITWDGRFALCDADHEAKVGLGNIFSRSIKSVWLEAFRQLQLRHMAGDFSFPLCTTCDDWKVGKSEVYRPVQLRQLSSRG